MYVHRYFWTCLLYTNSEVFSGHGSVRSMDKSENHGHSQERVSIRTVKLRVMVIIAGNFIYTDHAMCKKRSCSERILIRFTDGHKNCIYYSI